MDEKYLNQVNLVVSTLQHVSKEDCFALKGGTAINLFYNNLSRLSVDIDLTYLGFEVRDDAYKNINLALERIAKSLNTTGYKATIQGNNIEKKIICSNSEATIKIEPNYIIRGYVHKPEIMITCEAVEDQFGFAEIQIISKPELYGGKICAALDRQHPRDLFDINEYFIKNDFDYELTKGFIAMLLSHDKPLHEILKPNIKDQTEIFEKQFIGMTDSDFTYQNHIETLTRLIKSVRNNIWQYKDLLLDFVSLKVNLEDFNIPNLDKLPAIKWKIYNLKKLQSSNLEKFKEQYMLLKEYFKG